MLRGTAVGAEQFNQLLVEKPVNQAVRAEQKDVARFATDRADLRLNEPRFVKLPEIIKAKKKPLDIIEAATLGVTVQQRIKPVHYAPPAARARGVMVKSVDELAAALAAKGLLS